MAASMLQNSKQILNRLPVQNYAPLYQQVRTHFRTRHSGLPPDKAKNWKQKKYELFEHKDPELDLAVNIGFAAKPGKSKLNRTDMRNLKLERNMVELEKQARHRELVVPVDSVERAQFEGLGQKRIHSIAEHYGIYRDIFGDAYFYPKFQLGVGYNVEEEADMINPVFHGNILTPTQTVESPIVEYKGESEKMYTLCMTAPDSHLTDMNGEYMHWMIANIPGRDVEQGETIFDYLPIFPVNGTGYHRYVFVLYQHDKKLNVEGKFSNSTSLTDRTFNTLEFYREHQDQITPVGLSFFQAEWDETVRSIFHKTLDMDEPRYEFLPPLEYIPKQKLWPIREPFNVYMDRYRDVKDIGEEVLKEKLKIADPFKPRPEKKRYPNTEPLGKEVPSWLKIRQIEKRSRKSYWKYLDD